MHDADIALLVCLQAHMSLCKTQSRIMEFVLVSDINCFTVHNRGATSYWAVSLPA